jgi:hypothetical protein
MLLIGCSPPERNIEQHDIYFGIGEDLKDLVPGVMKFWPDATKNKLHFDAWREVTIVNGYRVTVVPADDSTESPLKLFFINLGGYKADEFEEFHYKMIIAAPEKSEAITVSKKTAFFRHTGIRGATAHIDDKYGIDVDDIFEIKDILGEELKKQFRIIVAPGDEPLPEDEVHLGYFKLSLFN